MNFSTYSTQFCRFANAFGIILLSLFIISTSYAQGDDYMFLTLTDLAHEKSLVAGGKYDGKVYHQPSIDKESDNLRDIAQWQFISTGDGYYHIKDRRHGKVLVAGTNYDGNIYHQDPQGRDNAKWRLVPRGGNGRHFQVIDKKHDKALMAGDSYNGEIYHQDPGNRSNAIWRLDPVQGDGLAPEEMVLRNEK